MVIVELLLCCHSQKKALQGTGYGVEGEQIQLHY